MLTLCGPRTVAAADGQRVAVVIGISTYANLPDELDLPQARIDARTLARTLEDEAGYDQVHLMLDSVATRTALEDLLLKTLPGQLGSDDTLLVYFTGHGVGGDFDNPYLLPFDVDPAAIPETAISIEEFGNQAQAIMNVGGLAIITDAAHPGQVGEFPVIGPHAKSWPELTDNFFTLSASSPHEVPSETHFAAIVTEGLRGAADISSDHQVTASELHRYVLDRMITESNDQVHPAEAGTYNPSLVLSVVSPDYVEPGTVVEPPPPVEHESSGKGIRIAGAACLVGAAATGGAGVYTWLNAKRYFGYAYDDTVELPDGLTREEAQDKYDELRNSKARWILLGATVGLGAAGGTLMVVPTAGGFNLGWAVTF